MNRLNGYKTYIQVALILIGSVIYYYGFIAPDVYILILGLLGAGSVASVRHAISNK